MEIIQLLLFIMIVLTLLNGIVFFKKLIKLQEETNVLLRKISENQSPTKNESDSPMPSEDLEKLKTSYMAKMKKYV
jgi:hypothetical protein